MRQLRTAARKTKDGPLARRLLALAAVYDGATRTEATRIGGVTLQIVRDWVVKFNASAPEGLIDRKAPGQPARLNDMHRAALAGVIESGPIPAIHGVVRWRIIDLCQWVWDEFQVSVAKPTLSRELRGFLHGWLRGLRRGIASTEIPCRDLDAGTRTRIGDIDVARLAVADGLHVAPIGRTRMRCTVAATVSQREVSRHALPDAA